MKKFKELFKKENKKDGQDRLISTEQENAITQITSILKQQGIDRPVSDITQYLKLCKNDIYEASQHLTCLALAEVGILINMSLSEELLGVENASGTSCYIDTILFAMYSQETAFDCLLQPRKLKNKDAEELQILCRFFVNLLRSSILIRAQIVEDIRNKLIESGWGTNKYSQEDAAEFFLFLSDIFELPYLPFNVQLFHGANEDHDDMKITADRILPLSLPDKNRKSSYEDVLEEQNTSSKSSKLLCIEDLLLDHFNSNKISGIRRNLSLNDSEKEAITDAWSVLKLLPFYTSQNELGNLSRLRESDIDSPDLILPLMIKRYSQKPGQLEVIRDNRPITLSIDINFNNFIKRMDDAIHDKSQNQYRLHLKSVVCHIGTSLQSGHYIVFVRNSNNNWVQMDDLNQTKVTNHNTVKAATQAFEIMSRNSYLLFYQLKSKDNKPRYKLREDTNISIDHKLATNIQAMEFLNDESNKDKSCAMQ